MNISMHSCLKPQVWARGLKIAATLLCTSMLYLETIHAMSNYTAKHYRLTNTIHFHSIQCPSLKRSNSLNYGNEPDDSHCLDIPGHRLHQHYNPYKSIFQQQPLRPFSFRQQLAMLDLFDTMGITDHKYDLITMVNLTQKKNLSELTKRQLEQAREWREIEGAVVHEKACRNDSECKEKVSTALFKMGMYDPQVPAWQHYDYTILLGGSIQQMQLRMIMLLSLFQASLKTKKLDLGQIVVLTCNRLVLKEETSETSSITMFEVSHDQDSERAKAFIDDENEVLLTETTSYQALYHSLKKMSKSPEYFDRYKETSAGYHTTLPVSFLARNSFEMKLYKRSKHTFQLSKQLPKVLTQFFVRYPELEIVETRMQKRGATLKKRPTTKQTVKEWLDRRDNKLSCKVPTHCKILVISNAPNTHYQHTAVLQALEESITLSTNLTYEVSTAGPGASLNIPTNALLDNVSKLIYLEAIRPEY